MKRAREEARRVSSNREREAGEWCGRESEWATGKVKWASEAGRVSGDKESEVGER